MERSLWTCLFLMLVLPMTSSQEYSNGCASWDPNFNCLSCHYGYYFRGGVCFPVSILCATYDNSTGDCLTCVPLYSLSSGICFPIPITNCDTQVGTVCSLCKPNFYLNGNACLKADTHCNSYSNGKCLSCSSGFLPFNDVCLASIANCLTYAADNSCTLCASGFLYLAADKVASPSATD